MFAGKVQLCEHTETNAHEHTAVQKASNLITEYYPRINIKKYSCQKKKRKKVAQPETRPSKGCAGLHLR